MAEQLLGSGTIGGDGSGSVDLDAAAAQLQPGDTARIRLDLPVPINWLPNVEGLAWTIAERFVAVTGTWLEGTNTLWIEWRV